MNRRPRYAYTIINITSIATLLTLYAFVLAPIAPFCGLVACIGAAFAVEAATDSL